jgi:hypothetical protein
MAGIRNQTADPARYASFVVANDGGFSVGYFDMQVNGQEYFCVAPPSMIDLFKTVMASSGLFSISCEIQTGLVNSLSVQTGSSLKNASSL